MIRKIIFLGFILFVFSGSLSLAKQIPWTEKKLGKVILKAEKAARQNKWGRAIKYSEQVLLGSNTLDKPTDARYIHLLKNSNKYYDYANRLNEVSERVSNTYLLSKEHLGLTHEITMTSRNLYYKLLSSTRDYAGAIPLILETIFIAEHKQKNNFRTLHYLEQLSILYRLTKQYKKEENILLKSLALYKRLIEPVDQDYINIVLMLSQNYCLQKMSEKFEKLTSTYDLKITCP